MFSVYFWDDLSGVCVGSVAAAVPGRTGVVLVQFSLLSVWIFS